MAIELAWNLRPRLAALHLAYCATHHGNFTSFHHEDSHKRLSLLGGIGLDLAIPDERFWDLIFQLSPDCSTNDDLGHRLCIRSLRSEERSEAVLSRLRSGLREAELAFASEFPNFASEMELRQRPLQQQWEAYGPGLLYQISQFLEGAALVEKAEVCLVPPVSGGMGWAHLRTNRCHLEALLTNVDPEITEVLRLAWLLSQLDFERPLFSDRINAFHLRRVAGLAMLPATLAAAEQLGLCRFSLETISRAVELWRLEMPGNRGRALAEVLIAWWETVRASQADWPLALTGLDRMISD